MPNPIPEPPVKRYSMDIANRFSEDYANQCWTEPRESDTGRWCEWSDVNALLVQRAQAIHELQEREARLHEIVADINSVCELPDDLREQVNVVLGATDSEGHCGNPICQRISELEAALTARTQALDQLQGIAGVPLDPPLHVSGHFTLGDSGKYVAHNVAAFMSFVFAALRLSPVAQATVSEREITDAADAARVSRAPQLSENEEDLSRVAPLTAGAAATGSTAEDRTGNAESAERTETMQELIAEYRRIRACSPATPWCPDPRYGNTDHYDGHCEAKDAILKQIFAAALRGIAATPPDQEP